MARDWGLLLTRALDRAAEAATDAAECAREGKIEMTRSLLAEASSHLDTAETRMGKTGNG